MLISDNHRMVYRINKPFKLYRECSAIITTLAIAAILKQADGSVLTTKIYFGIGGAKRISLRASMQAGGIMFSWQYNKYGHGRRLSLQRGIFS